MMVASTQAVTKEISRRRLARVDVDGLCSPLALARAAHPQVDERRFWTRRASTPKAQRTLVQMLKIRRSDQMSRISERCF